MKEVTIQDNNRIKPLDGLRAIAVLMVISFHLLNNAYVDSSITSLNKLELIIMHATSLGWAGVNLFFILSGFLIGSILLRNKNSTTFFKTFYLRRFFRIVPVYYLLLVIFFILTISPVFNPRAVLFEKPIPLAYYLAFLQNFQMSYRGNFGPEALTPTWSLAVEEQFYIIIPLIVYYFKPGYLKYFIAFCILAAPLTRAFTTNWYAEYTLLPSRIDNPVVGFLIAYLYTSEKFRLYISHKINYMRILLILMVAIFGLLSFKFHIGVLNQTIIGLIFAIVLILVLELKRGILYNFLSNKYLGIIGKYSYFIYLFHQLFNQLFHLYFLGHLKPVLENNNDYVFTLFALIVTVLLSAISFKYLENPIISYSHKFKYERSAKGIKTE